MEAGDLSAAEGHLEGAIEAARADEARGPEASALGYLAQCLIRAGRPGDAVPHAEAAEHIAQELGDLDAKAHFGRLRAAAEQQARPEWAELREVFGLGNAALSAGEPITAEPALREALRLAEVLHEPRVEAHAGALMAQALLLLGRQAEAHEQAKAALALAERLAEPAMAQQIAQIVEQTGRPGIELTLARAVSALEAERPEDAVGILKPALVAGATEPRDLAWLHGLLAKAHLASGAIPTAAYHAEKALELAEAAGDEEAEAAFRTLLARAAPNLN